MRVGFLYNHDQIHQIAHSLPIAIELSRRNPTLEIVILSGGAHLSAEVGRLLALAGAALPIRELALTSRSARLLAGGLERLLPATKLALYRDNLETFAALDMLVVTEKTSTILKTRYGLDRLKIVHTRHGAGDRAIGFDPASRLFDHVLVAGETIRDRLIAEAGVARERITVVGYPKFDLAGAERPRLPMQANGRPTILYNPHVAPHLSSWYRHGRAVLAYFVASDRYNLIFAPHVMLFHRRLALTISPPRLARPGTIPRAVRDAPNIHVDLSGPACTDMTYTMAADIYLGDVSSQIYEFLRRPRPCIFLNSHRVDHAGNPDFAHWGAGRVIDAPAALDDALAEAVRAPASHAEAQQRLFRHHIELTAERSSVRAARALERLMPGAVTPDGRPLSTAAAPPADAGVAGIVAAGQDL